MTNYRRLMAENTGRVVNSLVFLVTMFGHDVFTLFNLSSADNNLVFFMTHLFMMTLLFIHDIVVQGTLNIQVPRRKFSEGMYMGNNSMRMWSSKEGSRRKCLCCTGQKKKSTRSEHSDNDGDCLSSFSADQVGRISIIITMLRLCALLLLSSATQALPSGAILAGPHYHGAHSHGVVPHGAHSHGVVPHVHPLRKPPSGNLNVECTLNYNIVHEEKCHHKVCHEEHEVVVSTTEIEECEDIVTKHCHQEHKAVHHTSSVLGHESSVVGHHVGHSYVGKRDADAGLGYSSGPQCQEQVERKCHKKPIQDMHKIPHQKCHSKPVCHKVAVKVPNEICIGLSFSKPRRKPGSKWE